MRLKTQVVPIIDGLDQTTLEIYMANSDHDDYPWFFKEKTVESDHPSAQSGKIPSPMGWHIRTAGGPVPLFGPSFPRLFL